MGIVDTNTSTSTILDEVTLVPTSSGGVLEDRGRVTLETPDVVVPQLTTPISTLPADQPTTLSLDEVIMGRQRRLLALTLLAPLDKNDFAMDLQEILTAIVEKQDEYLIAVADLAATTSSLTKSQLRQHRRLREAALHTEKAEKKLLQRIGKLFKAFSDGNNWPRLLAAWKVLIQPEFALVVEKTEWLEVMARQAWQLLGKDWQKQARQATLGDDVSLNHFFATYGDSQNFTTTALGQITIAQLREFLTPVILSFTMKSPDQDEVGEAQTVWGQYLAAREVVALRAQLKKLQTQAKKQKPTLGTPVVAPAPDPQLVEKISQFQHDLDTYKDSNKSLALKSLDEEIRFQQLQEKLTTSQFQVEQLREKAEELKVQLEQVQTKQARVGENFEQVTTLEQRLNQLADQNQALEKYLSKLDQENARLRQQPSPAVKTAALEKRLDDLAASYQDSRLEISNLRQLNEQLELEVAATKQANWRLEQENNYVPSSPPSVDENTKVSVGLGVSEAEVIGDQEIFPAIPSYASSESDLVAPELPQFEAPIITTPGVVEQGELKTFTPSKQHLQALGLTLTRLSSSFPLFSRRGLPLSFAGISEELERVLGGSLYALEKSRR